MNCCFVELLGAPFPSGTWNYKYLVNICNILSISECKNAEGETYYCVQLSYEAGGEYINFYISEKEFIFLKTLLRTQGMLMGYKKDEMGGLNV